MAGKMPYWLKQGLVGFALGVIFDVVLFTMFSSKGLFNQPSTSLMTNMIYPFIWILFILVPVIFFLLSARVGYLLAGSSPNPEKTSQPDDFKLRLRQNAVPLTIVAVAITIYIATYRNPGPVLLFTLLSTPALIFLYYGWYAYTKKFFIPRFLPVSRAWKGEEAKKAGIIFIVVGAVFLILSIILFFIMMKNNVLP